MSWYSSLLQHYIRKAMGNTSSSPFPEPPIPPPSPTFKHPWRQISWGDNERDLQYMRAYQPQTNEVSHLRVLLYGPVGAGKSSFINSVSNTLRRKMTNPAAASATNSERSFTKKYEAHKIQKESRGNSYPFVFTDIMGIEEGTERGVSVEDIKLAMKGHVTAGYKFNPVSPLSSNDPGYNPSPSQDDKVHVLVCVCSANAAEIKHSVLTKMMNIREEASDLGIPQLAIVTKIDEACGDTEKDLKNVYKSKYVKKKMTEFSSALGIPMNCIFPVKNYSEEICINNDVDTLILSAMKLIIDLGDDFINKL